SGVWGEPSYPKPNISLSPSGEASLGGAVAIWCQGQHRGMRFVLDKEGRNVSHVDPVRSEAVFSISIVRWEHGGSYSCYYCNRSEQRTKSYPSDPVELVVRAPPDFTRANIARLALGATVLLILGLILAEAYNSHPRGGTLGEVTPTSVPLSPPMSLDPTVQG
ncbi:leukocyte immunoglobulin like receptor A4, partial [Chelydra serpentina]